jgi:hypothetical protein
MTIQVADLTDGVARMTKEGKQQGGSGQERRTRLAEKLRENLRRRKAQMRERRMAREAAEKAPPERKE